VKRLAVTLFLILSIVCLFADPLNKELKIISYSVDSEDITFFHKSPKGDIFGNFASLKRYLKSKGKNLLFATNGGMYLKDLTPQGLYIENGKIIKKVNTKKSNYGNFYMSPNGVFYIKKDGKAYIKTTQKFYYTKDIKYATQSGPMLVIDGKNHHKFNPKSNSIYIRNGVGLLPDGRLLFAISSIEINFYNFANFFKKRGCKNALYLDGFVSRIYLPEHNITNQDFIFGIIIAQTK
jgi:uncharacterized protein YigE (DUF2233 family)